MRYLATHNIGNFIHPNVRASFQAAAKRWGCDYLEVDRYLGKAKDPLGSKMQLHHLDVPDGAQVRRAYPTPTVVRTRLICTCQYPFTHLSSIRPSSGLPRGCRSRSCGLK